MLTTVVTYLTMLSTKALTLSCSIAHNMLPLTLRSIATAMPMI